MLLGKRKTVGEVSVFKSSDQVARASRRDIRSGLRHTELIWMEQ